MRCLFWLATEMVAIAPYLAAASPAPPPPTPTPSVFQGLRTGKPVLVPEPIRTPEQEKKTSLTDWASRNRKQGSGGERAGTVSGGVPDTRLRLLRFRVEAVDDGVEVRGSVWNVSAERLHVVLVIEGRRFDGDRVSETLSTASSDPIGPGEEAQFAGAFVGVDAKSIRARAVVQGEIVGKLETATERRLSACLAFEAVLPDGPGSRSESVEIRARNGCQESVPSGRTWFHVVVRNALGEAVAHKADLLHEPVPARGLGRRQVTIRVPAAATVTVTPYDPTK